MFDFKGFRKDKKIGQKVLIDLFSCTQGYISALETGRKQPTTKQIELLKYEFGDISSYITENITDRQLPGEGEMLKTESHGELTPEKGKLIPFYDVEAAAGNGYDVEMSPARQSGMIEIGTVLRDSQSAIRVYGNSMVPNYPAGCVIGLKLHTDSFIEPGRVYVVETLENRYLKRLYYTDDKASFHCLSDNQMKYEDGPRKGKLYYQDFEIPINDVIRLHRVVGVIKRNIL